ncbi:hypothetical protein OG589_14650 [Sphaerisporangium sp. NBC_01403]|uniref:hypothetical protein n=1 Tax=Sphaerisporangium sp. NBC_01403 TaxID=2903599 RepID=UPI003251EF10
MSEALKCTRCGSRVAICETVEGWLDWGLAVLGDDGVVRPERCEHPPPVMADNSTPKATYAVCDNTRCGHRWKLRRRFDSASLPADGEQTGGDRG